MQAVPLYWKGLPDLSGWGFLSEMYKNPPTNNPLVTSWHSPSQGRNFTSRNFLLPVRGIGSYEWNELGDWEVLKPPPFLKGRYYNFCVLIRPSWDFFVIIFFLWMIYSITFSLLFIFSFLSKKSFSCNSSKK